MASIPNAETSLKILIKKPITVPPQTTVYDARDILLKYRIGRLIIQEDQKPVGIITEKDFVRYLSTSKRPPSTVQIKDIMSKNLITLTADRTVSECASLMKQNKISSVVIVNDDYTLDGIITKTDLVSFFLMIDSASLKASKIMTKKIITASPNDSIFEVQSILLNHKIGRVVVAKNQVPVGIITYRDFIPAKLLDLQRDFIEPEERTEVFWSPYINDLNISHPSYLLTFTANDIMSKNIVHVEPTDPVYTCAIIMIRHGISGLPVVKNKKLVGIITKSDLVNILANSKKQGT